ncbi:MAG TPA: hypothetical protein VM784_08415 [Actinomycetota bacterium]|nr:hypothetical protein [Actinomycetota bacterium]
MIDLVDDDLCDAIAAAGPIDEVRDRMEAWTKAADRIIVAGPW